MIEVMFVDDEAHVLAALRRSLHHLKKQWRMRFASSAAEALEQLQETPADVVVSDMRMPGMNGQVFLCHVRDRWPGAIRVVLSGQTELESALASVDVSHRFLDKPCGPDVLEETVQRLLVIRERIGSPRVREFVGAIGSLPSTPSVIAELNSALLDPQVTNHAVVAILERDPAVTAKLLQLANSALLGIDEPVNDVATAVDCLGIAAVRDLATATAAFSALSPSSPDLSSFTEQLESHSLRVALLAAEIAGEDVAKQAFAAGMLHDIGQLIVAANAPEQWAEINTLVATGIARPTAELSVLGVTHAEIGSYLLALWGLPGSLYEAVAWHHDAPAHTPWAMAPVHAVHLAEHVLEHDGGVLAHLDPEYVSALGVGTHLAAVAEHTKSVPTPRWEGVTGLVESPDQSG
jgi:HD-like signal output (HDOD) protein